MYKFDLSVFSEEFDRIGHRRTIRSHETLVPVGRKADSLYVVEKGGCVLLFVHPKTGEERAINFFIPGFHPIATVAESFANGQPSKYRLATFTNSQVIEIKKSAVTEHLNALDLTSPFHQYGVQTLLEKNDLRAMLISLNSEEMLQYLHEHYPQILQQVPSKYIANFLGITPQWLSKIKHKL
ncbi:Crp/Fnr family transcriptional regulator [bacterium SCSIO 12741]|nr:Crp/Fnr family transcriptional regulator [bacterium SCSIO 12741]